MADLIVHSLDPVVLVGGSELGPQDLNILPIENPCFVGVDAGADHLLAAGITPVAVIGDLDSLSANAADAFADVLHRIDEQDTVDFEKALTQVTAPLIYAFGFSGGRLDHSLAVLDVIGRHARQPVVLVGPDDCAAVLPTGEVTLTGMTVGARISILPLAPAQVQAQGLRWAVDQQQMAPLGFSSPSNEISATTVTITTDAPVLLVLRLSDLAQLAAAMMG